METETKKRKLAGTRTRMTSLSPRRGRKSDREPDGVTDGADIKKLIQRCNEID